MSESRLELSNTVSFELDGDVLLFVESSNRMILLNETASSIWRGLQSAMSVSDISEELAARTGCSPERALRDCAESIERWQELGVFKGEQQPSGTTDEPEARPGTEAPASADLPTLENSYRLLGLSFVFRATHPSDAQAVYDLVGHLSVQGPAPVQLIFDLVRSGGRYVLHANGRVLDECEDRRELVPMVHANLLLAAYRHSDCVAGLHAAAVARGEHCILMPGISGSGKSTLTAALLAHGFEYCTDDLVLLTGDPIHLRAFPMRIGLKSGTWRALETRWPEISSLPVHRRADGKFIRYFLPQKCLGSQAGPGTYEPTCIVFPRYREDAGCDLRRIGSGDALMRLTEAGYDLPNRLDRQVVSTLVDWLSATPCYELDYSPLDQAIDAMSAITS